MVDFENSRTFQAENTIYPLKHSSIDGGASPEPKTVKSELSKQQIEERKRPIYPYPKDQEKVPFVKKVTQQSPTKMQVMLFKEDTDYLLRYQFEMINSCWKLAEYNDDSL